MKIRRAKKKYPGSVQTPNGTASVTEEGFNAIGLGLHSLGFSYRGMWTHEGCPGSFEAWLVSKGVISSSGPRERPLTR
ncbi:hypothetical protein J2Z31_003107 [Sinorhizobium kostiense]|uniref:Uncharacterized protein n=1 Tax=Sinorhizobium kostiense TaxID=76747 RepID=A0ABS4R109_9HYPH|nr:hypothetical protein [Sinorhizobium kostiense]